MYELDGQDWSKGSEAATQWSLSLPKRITKQNYDETAHQQRGLRMPKQVQIHDFQFFDARRLHALRDQEVAHWQWKQDRVLARRAREEEEEDEDELTRKASAAGVPPLSDAELDERESTGCCEQRLFTPAAVNRSSTSVSRCCATASRAGRSMNSWSNHYLTSRARMN